jgi:hypothetical protein
MTLHPWIERMRRNAGLIDMRLHDLRRTLRTGLAELGVNFEIASGFSTTRCPAFRRCIIGTIIGPRNALLSRCGPSMFLRSQKSATRRLWLFVPLLPDKLPRVTRIGRPADKRVFLPRFRVACTQERSQEAPRPCRPTKEKFCCLIGCRSMSKRRG